MSQPLEFVAAIIGIEVMPYGWTRAKPACAAADRSSGQLHDRLDAVHLRSTRLQPADRNHRRRDSGRRLSHRLAVDYRRHSELREAGRRARHLAGITFPLANPHLLVRPPVGLALYSLRHRHARPRNPDCLAADGRRRTLVYLPHRSGLAGAQQSQADVHLTAADAASLRIQKFFLLTFSSTSSRPVW